jgi:hypothetical protein
VTQLSKYHDPVLAKRVLAFWAENPLPPAAGVSQILADTLAVYRTWTEKPRRERKPRIAPPAGLRTPDEAAARLGISIKTHRSRRPSLRRR